MKKSIFSKITMVFVMLIMCVSFLVGCTNIPIDIDTNADVTGNGTLAVQKGNYLYFVNGYTSISDMKDGDNLGGNSYSAIYRAKLENGNLTYDEDGKLKNVDKIVDKVAGYDKTKLYIFGDFLYYSTPNTEEPKDTEASKYKLTDFYSVKLNGEDREHIYKTPKASDTTKYEFIATEKTSTKSKKQVYLAVYQENSIVVINCYSKSQVFAVEEDVESCVIPSMSNYLAENNNLKAQQKAIYFSRKATDEEASSGNVLASYALGEREEVIIAKGANTYTAIDVQNGGLLYTEKDSHDATNYKYASFSEDGSLNLANAKTVISKDNVSDVIYLCKYENENYKGAIYKTSESGLSYINANGDITPLLDGKKLTALCLENDFVFAYDDDKSIYKIDYVSNVGTKIYDTTAKKDVEDEESENWPSPYFDAKTNFAVNGNYIYFYVKYTGDDDKSGYYLNRVKLSAGTGEATLVGILEAEHIKTPAEESEE